MTSTEQKTLFFIMFLIILGTTLEISGYSPPLLKKDEFILSDQEKLSVLLAVDFQPRYDLNKVTYDELIFLRYIGPSTAQAILEYQQNIGFKRVDDLINIRGIGDRRLEEFREYFFVEGDSIRVSNTNIQIADTVVSVTNNTRNNTQNRLININTATQDELITLRGIGPTRALAIIEYRTNHGRFRTIDDIVNVQGIGSQTFENIKEYITVGN